MPAPAVTPAPLPASAHPLDGWEDGASPRGSRALASRESVRALALQWGPYILIATIALATRLRYAWWSYNDTFSSGDAHLVLTKAWLIRQGDLEPGAAVGPAAQIFASPPLVPLMLAAFSAATSTSVAAAVLIVGPALTIVALLALYAMAARATDRTIAVIGVSLVAMLPRFTLDSTEPDKVAYVMSFSILALWLLYVGQQRAPLLLASGACLGLAVFSHTTAYLFVPVFVLSHVALSWGSWRRIANPWFLSGCAVALAFFAAYVWLDDAYSATPAASSDGQPVAVAPSFDAAVPSDGPIIAPPTPSPPATDSPLVPNVIEDYWRNLKGMGEDGFQDSAWDLYFDGIRGQLLDPMYVVAIAGFLLAATIMVRQHRFVLAPLLLWMLLVTVGFAIQQPAPSHGTRYPSYVTPVFVIMAVFAVVTASRWLIQRFRAEPAYALALAAPFVAWAGISYLTSPEPGTRRLYEGHRNAAEYVTSQGILSDGNELLYLAWPSYTYWLLDGGADIDTLHTFGWQAGAVNQIDAAYIERNQVRYLLHDSLLDDYFKSSTRISYNLAQAYVFREMHSFCTAGSDSGCAGTVRLYELVPKQAAHSPLATP